jgi:hypothetical protein
METTTPQKSGKNHQSQRKAFWPGWSNNTPRKASKKQMTANPLEFALKKLEMPGHT